VDEDLIAAEFEAARPRLEAIARRLLGSADEAQDALQEAWLRLDRAGPGTIDNLAGWLTTVVARVALDMLKARDRRRDAYAGDRPPEPVVTIEAGSADPEHEALVADSVGLALLVVLETLGPRERLAFVLHDMFAVSFREIADVLDTTPDAARQLASRGRRRLRGAPPAGAAPAPRRDLVDAFLLAAREGDFDALIAVLDPDVVFRQDATGGGRAREPIVGAEAVARTALGRGRPFAALAQRALVNGGPGVVVASGDRVLGVAALTIDGDRIVEIDLVTDPDRLRGVREAWARGS
jgi:RNA polymerase sigma factor (sigma-70 family)